jgi:hypothetical protein
MRGPAAIIRRLASVPVFELRATSARIVPLGDLVKNSQPDFLFTSGKPNRFNPAGIECVYFSEDEATAGLEYARQWVGLRAGKQPKVTFYAEVRLRRVIDLTSPDTLRAILSFGHLPRGCRHPRSIPLGCFECALRCTGSGAGMTLM